MTNKKVLIITGVSSGIGLVTAKYFAEKGYKVYGLARRKIDEKGIISISCDITDSSQIENALSNIMQQENKIDLLINNAGFGISGSCENEELSNVKKQFDVNFFGAVNITQKVLPIMRKQGYGKILNTSSVASVIPIPFQSFYSATKASLDIWAKAVQMEVKPYNIQICNVLVGDTKTGFTSVRQKTNSEKEGVYAKTVEKSILKMEKDEQNGKNPLTVAKTYYKLAQKRKLPPTKTIGALYKLIVFFKKLLPEKFALWVISKLYS